MILFILIGSLFCLAGCAQLYKLIGLSDEQTADQVAADQADRQKIIQGIRLTTTELITTAIAAAGAIASGFLAKWLTTEKKITTAMITGVEKSNDKNVKESIKDESLLAGVQPQLHARVKSLT
ncbi:hypothetical protein ES703_60907 [subsurface metagenome]